MNMNSVLCKFINSHKANWREVLSKEPYLITIRETAEQGYENLCIFNYTQGVSDFTLPEVQEARGIIINVKTLEVVCWPFRKFANFGEPYADEIDWSTARVTEKIDGSIIKVWYNKQSNKWEVSTNGTINAYSTAATCVNSITCSSISFGNVFDQVINPVNRNRLNKDKTYIFELCTPYNRVIVEHKESKIYHIGTRNNITGQESNDDIGVEKPKEFKLSSLEACRLFAEADVPQGTDYEIPKEQITFEGLVVNDAEYNRIKVKSWKYVAAHYYTTHVSKRDIVTVILKGETEEFLSYFPNNKEALELYSKKIDEFSGYVDRVIEEARTEYGKLGHNRKKFSEEWCRTKNKLEKVLGFNAIDGKTTNEIINHMHFNVNSLISYIDE